MPVEQGLAVGVARRPTPSNLSSHSACAARPRSTTWRACASTSPSTSKVLSGFDAQDLLGGGDLVGAQRAAVRLAGVLRVRCRPGDDRAQRDEGRPVGDRAAPRRSAARQRLATFSLYAAVRRQPVDPLHVPAVGLVARGGVLGQRDVRVVLDRDVVVVVEQGEVAQPLGAGQRRRLAADALLDVAVGGDAPDVVVEQALALGGVRVEQAALATGRHRHADGVADALARAGRWSSRRRRCGRARGAPG